MPAQRKTASKPPLRKKSSRRPRGRKTDIPGPEPRRKAELSAEERERTMPGHQFMNPGTPVSDVELINDEVSDPRNACGPGSIEQELDMCEAGPIRGDEIGRLPIGKEIDTPIKSDFAVDMSEENREGDDESGDEHSSGFEGGDSELRHQQTTDTGLPGEAEERIEEIEEDWKKLGAKEPGNE